MERPKCRRCGGPLDIWHDEEQGVMFICNNPETLQNDEQFQNRLDNLKGDDVAKLERYLENRDGQKREGWSV